MRKREYKIYCADFETTVYEGQTETEVWVSAIVQTGTEDVTLHHSIDDFMQYIFELAKKNHIKIFFHNLKFDGSFILDWAVRHTEFKPAFYHPKDEPEYVIKWYKDKEMLNHDYKYLISDMNQWYMITFKMHNHFILICDSFKLLPMSLDKIGKSFQTKHQKLDMVYEGYRYAGCDITPEEQEYIKNDVLVMKEALEIMFSEGHTKLTIGACCLEEYKRLIGKYDFKDLFPNMAEVKIDKEIYGSENADEYIRKAYRGGWCYLVKGKEGKVFHDGITLDVNSLYPSVLSGESNNCFPYAFPFFWSGDYIPDEAKEENRYFFIRFKCRFHLRKGFLPTIQIKNSGLYKRNEYLETSKIKICGEYYTEVMVGDRVITDQVTLTLTQTDYELFLIHYEVWDFVILDGCWFRAKSGLFDCYIEKYKRLKMESTGARRQISKAFLNNLYGKLATGNNSSFKIAYLNEDDYLSFRTIAEHEKKLVYIPAGCACTAYARKFTIDVAQANFYGAENPGFVYSDTDSVHISGIPVDEVKGVRLSDTEFLCWKHESSWVRGLFLRQKTYIEETDEINVTACGMGKRCKQLICNGIRGTLEARNEMEQEFYDRFHELEDFEIGLEIPSNLKQKRMKGGVVLMEDYFCLR